MQFTNQIKEPPPNSLDKIGGGLILFAILLILQVCDYTLYWFTDIFPMMIFFKDPQDSAFNPILNDLLKNQGLFYSVMIGMYWQAVYHFFAKKSLFPWEFLAINLAFLLGDIYYSFKMSEFLPDAQFGNKETIFVIVFQIVMILGAWGYLFWGDRCRRTFWR